MAQAESVKTIISETLPLSAVIISVRKLYLEIVVDAHNGVFVK
jgi:hypothetical protein